MIDLEKRKLLLATAILPLAFGIVSCSSYPEMEEEAVVQSNEENIIVYENETIVGYPSRNPMSANEYYSRNVPAAGGLYAEQVPYDVLNEQYGNMGEDLSSTVPSEGNEIIVSDNSSDCLEERFELVTDAGTIPASGDLAQNGGASSVGDAVNLQGAEEGTIESAEPVEDWLAPEGASLRSLLSEWADRRGWKVVWKSDREYVLEAGAVFRGRYVDVTSALIRTFARARPAPIATFYKGNMVLLITTLEDENAD